MWAAWRMAYIAGLKGTVKGCLFCHLREKKPAKKTLVLESGPHAFLVVNAFPYNSGHVMVVPRRHVGGTTALREEEALAFMRLTARAEHAIREAYRPHGLNMGVNLGRTSGAGVVGHLHMHIVPRWNGDTNFMPVVGGTKVLPEALDTTYARLQEALERPRARASS
jgi:ATP adenylyltransferase